jgi:hypothetical protein
LGKMICYKLRCLLKTKVSQTLSLTKLIPEIKSTLRKKDFSQNYYIFEHCRKVQTRKRPLKRHYFCHKTLVLLTFLELPPIGLCLHYIKTVLRLLTGCRSCQNSNDFYTKLVLVMVFLQIWC